jgi:hypothetical protein
MPPNAADLLELESIHGLRGRTPAKAAGLKVFNGPTCPLRGHGGVRTIKGGHCVACIKAAATIKKAAQIAGREAALRAALVLVTRQQKATAKAKLKEEAKAIKEQASANRKQARATERTMKRAADRAAKRTAAKQAEQAAVGPLHDLDEDGRPPWE